MSVNQILPPPQQLPFHTTMSQSGMPQPQQPQAYPPSSNPVQPTNLIINNFYGAHLESVDEKNFQ